MKINSLSPDKHNYLQIISGIVKSPKTLYWTGTLPNSRLPSVAVVGSRKPTPYGKQVTFDLAYSLAKKGIVIISGLALGIDAIAHKAALEAGGTTIAILPGGLDTIYPRTHRQLALDIIKSGGALISEYPPGTDVRAFQLLARNRIVSGLADAVVVTEAAKRSGTLSTVAHALDQNREVFAVPGPITSPLSIGPNTLIKQGAHPVVSVDDIIEVIAPHLIEPQQLSLPTDPSEYAIVSLISQGVYRGQDIQTKSGLDASQFAQTLTMLEIQGVIRPLGNNQWTLK